MSQSIRNFIKEAALLREADEKLPSLNPFEPIVDTAKSTYAGIKNFFVSVFSDGFTEDQKLGIGEGSIIGSKVSIEKDENPSFVVLCKMQHDGNEYIIAKRYSKSADFNPVPKYGSYLDPNILINGTITSLPDPNKVYKIKKEEVIVSPVTRQLDTSDTRGAGGISIVRAPAKRSTTSLLSYALDPKVQDAAAKEADKRDAIKTYDTAVQAKKWVEKNIGFINGLNRKDPRDLVSDMQTLEKVWKIYPASGVDFSTGNVSDEGWLSIMTPKELFESNIGLFAFDPSSTVYPPPYSYTVEGIINRIEGDCAYDSKEYITKYWQNITGDLEERDKLNLAICSNKVAGDVVLNLVTLTFAVAGGPAAPAVIAGSIAIQGLSLIQLMTYQLNKGDKESATVTAARFLLLFIPFVKMATAYEIIVNIIQFIADIVGSGSVDVRWVKSLLNRLGLSDDDVLSSLPEAVNIASIDNQLASLPIALEENRIYNKKEIF